MMSADLDSASYSTATLPSVKDSKENPGVVRRSAGGRVKNGLTRSQKTVEGASTKLLFTSQGYHHDPKTGANETPFIYSGLSLKEITQFIHHSVIDCHTVDSSCFPKPAGRDCPGSAIAPATPQVERSGGEAGAVGVFGGSATLLEHVTCSPLNLQFSFTLHSLK